MKIRATMGRVVIRGRVLLEGFDREVPSEQWPNLSEAFDAGVAYGRWHHSWRRRWALFWVSRKRRTFHA